MTNPPLRDILFNVRALSLFSYFAQRSYSMRRILPNTWSKISYVLMGVIIAVIIASEIIDDSSAAGTVLIIIAFAALLFLIAGQIIFWRCPKCRKYLPRSSIFSAFRKCPYCGHDLNLHVSKTKKD